jgi:hypothetical protein
VRIPSDAGERQELYQRLTRECLASRRERFDFYRQLRNYYLFGTSDSKGAPYNKIASTIDTLASFVYAPAGARFSIHLGTTAPEGEILKVPQMQAELSDQWKQTKTHLTFGLGVKWSFVFGSMIFKEIWSPGSKHSRTYLVEPHQFGVLREDIIDLEDQEAFVHCYTTTKTQLESDLEGNPRAASILNAVSVGGGEASDLQYSTGLSRLLLSTGISSTTSSGTGGAPEGGLTAGMGEYDYSPRVDADLVDMCELYVWNDESNDYQMVTVAHPDVIVYDRQNVGVHGTPQFVKLAPEHNCYDYFWGESFVARLTTLQDWLSLRLDQVKALMERQVDPSYAFPGWTGLIEEKGLAYRKPGGFIANPPGAGKPEKMSPDFPPQIFTEIHELFAMFDDQAGIHNVLQGKGESGVRSKGQADLLARLSSARPKSRAIVIEEAAEDLATLKLRNIQENSRQRFVAKGLKGVEGSRDTVFIPEQFTRDFEVKVDAHSTSPIFIEDRKNDAVTLLEAKVIDREAFLDIYNPPDVQLLKERLKAIEAKEAAAAKMQMQAEAMKHGGAAGKPAPGASIQ